MRVKVYWNSIKKCWSIRGKDGTVINRACSLSLTDCRFIVWDGGRQRVLREKVKNVHAFVEGIISEDVTNTPDKVYVVYNPYKYKTFVTLPDETVIKEASRVILTTRSGKPEVCAVEKHQP